MTDLVERLRKWADDTGPGPFSHHRRIQEEAADELTRLRAEAEAHKERIAGLVNVGHALAATIEKQRAEVEALRADAERWRHASISRNFGISFWDEFGYGTCYGDLAAQRVDAARKA